MKISSLLCITLALLAGCSMDGSAPETKPTAAPTTGEVPAWHVNFNVSGGFAGISRQLFLNSSGMLKASDDKTGRQVESTLQDPQLTEIEGLLAELETKPSSANRARITHQCADCIEYRLNTSIDNQRNSMSFRSGTEMAPQYAALVTHLSALLQQALAE